MFLNSWKLFALASAFFAALTAIFGKLGVQNISSNLATFVRTVVIIVMIATIVTFRKEWALPQESNAKSWLFLLFSGLATGLSWLCYYRALQLGPVSKVAPVDKLSVVFAILLAALFLGEALDGKTLAGAFLIVLGATVLVI